MKPLLEPCGYNVVKPDGPDNIAAHADHCHAGVISLALISEINLSAESVLATIHRVNPQLPLVFASLLAFEQAIFPIASLLDKLGFSAQVMGLSSSNSITSQNSVLYLARDDLSATATREQTKHLLQRYMG